jgi:hypothetical protein
MAESVNIPYPLLAVPKSTNLPYLMAVLAITMIGVMATIAIIILRPNQDNAALFVAIGSFVGPTTTALLAFLKTQETHLLVNSRMDEFKSLLAMNAAAAEEIARTRGISQGLRERLATT